MRRAYMLLYLLIRPLGALLYPMRYVGREHIPEGAAIVCANHTSAIDPVLVAFALTRKQYPHFMAKIEVFKVPVLGAILRWIGTIPVDRSSNTGINSIRTAMKYLKEGDKLMLFPEGTRVREDEAADAKTGAIRLAMKLNVPILPVSLPRRKPLFGRGTVVIGEPYRIEGEKGARSDLKLHADELMRRISDLSEVRQ